MGGAGIFARVRRSISEAGAEPARTESEMRTDMKTVLFPLNVLRLVAGMAFVCLAGVLALIANGIGRAGWMLAGDRPAVPVEHPDLAMRLSSPAAAA